jgi:hypothetical protein
MTGLEILIIFAFGSLAIFVFLYTLRNVERDRRKLREYSAQKQTQKQVFDEEFLEARQQF